MPTVKFNTALIVGAGSGLSAALARVLATEGIKVALAARSTGDLDGLAKEIGAPTFACDASKRADVEKLFADLDGSFGAPEIVIYNPSYRTRGPIAELDPAEVEKALDGHRPSAASWSASRRSSACCRRSTAASCSPARPRA